MQPRHRFIECYSRQGRVAVLVEFGHEELHTAESPEFAELSRSIAMHIAVLNPQSTPVLLRQYYNKDPNPQFMRSLPPLRCNEHPVSVEAAMAAVATQLGDRITIIRFARWDTRPQPPSGLEPAVAMRQRRRE
jgi:translation elongation factor EF-Ts